MQICINNIFFELNQNDHTAKVVYSPSAEGDVVIPRSCHYQSREYIINSIDEGSFQENSQIKSIKFEEGSQLKSICKDAFSFSSLESISIPSSIEELKEGWCNGTQNLNNILISLENKQFSYLQTNSKLVTRRSASTNDYDTIVFACRNINEVFIPPSIKYIDSYAFNGCTQLQEIQFDQGFQLISINKHAFSNSFLRIISIPKHVKQICECAFSECKFLFSITFSKDSELNSIESYAFFRSLIRKISIPKQVTKISEYAFFRCNELHSVTFSEDSELVSIDEYAFSRSSIEKIYIPSKVKLLKEGWCGFSSKLNCVEISTENKNFSFLDLNNKIVGEKSDSKSENYDVINFACRDIEFAFISSSIKKISSFAFYGCKKIKTVNFSENSELHSICKKSFSNSSIENISIPKNVEQISEGAFAECENLKVIQFSEDSELKTICKEAFAKSSIEMISIPKNVVSIGELAFSECRFLKKVEFAKHSEIKVIEKLAFYFSSLEFIVIPPSVNKIERRAFSFCERIQNIEFLGDFLFIDFFSFKNSTNLYVTSFPNAKKVTIGENAFIKVSCNFALFIPSTAELNGYEYEPESSNLFENNWEYSNDEEETEQPIKRNLASTTQKFHIVSVSPHDIHVNGGDEVEIEIDTPKSKEVYCRIGLKVFRGLNRDNKTMICLLPQLSRQITDDQKTVYIAISFDRIHWCEPYKLNLIEEDKSFSILAFLAFFSLLIVIIASIKMIFFDQIKKKDGFGRRKVPKKNPSAFAKEKRYDDEDDPFIFNRKVLGSSFL